MSRTGNKGFTLIEVMVSVAVLAFGVILVYDALLKSLSAFGYYSDYFMVSSWMDEKIWQVQDALANNGTFLDSVEGTYLRNNREFPWSVAFISLDGNSGLYRIDLRIGSAKLSERGVVFTRSAYALFAKK
jgi:prepilin-type N-terminal cleavage/methylation domain-containing protein